MSELVAFLLARIEDDEQAARAAIEPSEMYPYGDKLQLRLTIEQVPGAVRDYLGGTWGEHFARHDPARVLAECDAKRRIVDLHKIHVEKDVERGRFNEETREFETCDYGYCTECDHDRDYGFIGSPAGLFGCPTLRLLALPFAGHPDYREEWKP